MRTGVAVAVFLAIAACGDTPAGIDAGPPPPADAGRPLSDAGPPGVDAGVDAGGVVVADPPPPPISGGTLMVTGDGTRVVAADPDRDVVWIVDSGSWAVRSVALEPYDEPGRLVEGPPGIAHVALRRGGALVTIDIDTSELIDRRTVCPAPRGVAYDGASSVVHVACSDGDLVTFPAGGGPESRRVFLDRDLRDVVVDGEQLLVSRFRTAELLYVDAGGSVTLRARPPSTMLTGRMPELDLVPTVAWRTVARPEGGALMLHQRAVRTTVMVEDTGYGGGACRASGVVDQAVSDFRSDGTVAPAAGIQGLVVAVDIAVAPDGSMLATANASQVDVGRVVSSGLFRVARSILAEFPFDFPCAVPEGLPSPISAAIAVGYLPDGRIVAQGREPAGLAIGEVFHPFPGATPRFDTGHALFHFGTGAFIACASCHPEGGEDGHVWDLAPTGPRRTQTLLGGLLGTEPFHWSGDVPDMTAIMGNTFTRRMGGGTVTDEEVDAIGGWLDAQPAPELPVRDGEAVVRGMTVFTEAGCASCHSGPKLTNNENADVGTGGSFQVPGLLGVAHRAPFMHDGCAATLADAVAGCGPVDAHGATSALSADRRDDLVAYLESL